MQIQCEAGPFSGWAEAYQRDGFVGNVPILTAALAARHRDEFERAEAAYGAPLHYVSKIHTIFTSPLDLVTSPTVLDMVTALIGPDILLLDVTSRNRVPRASSTGTRT